MKNKYRVGRHTKRAILHIDTGKELLVFPYGMEEDAQDYCDYLNRKEKGESIKQLILDEYKKGNIVVLGVDGIQTMPLKEFVKQPVDGMLYDLNRNEAVVLTFIDDPKWVNDYAVVQVIREFKSQIKP